MLFDFHVCLPLSKLSFTYEAYNTILSMYFRILSFFVAVSVFSVS